MKPSIKSLWNTVIGIPLLATPVAAQGLHEGTSILAGKLLSEIIVTAERYRIEDTNTGTRTGTPLIDTPLSIQSIPRAVLRDQASQSLEDAVRNIPGVYVQQGEGNRDEFYLRGVKTKSDFFSDGLRDDTEYYRDLYNVAHIDVLKGPAALLFGRGGAGGVFNLVTKQADGQPVRHAQFETGSYQHFRGTVDIGHSLGQNSAFRLMAMAENSGGFRDNFYLHRYAVNPKFHVDLGDKTEVDISFSYHHDRRLVDRGIPSRNGRPADVSRKKFFGSIEQNEAKSRVITFDARILHRVTDDLVVRNAFRVTDNNRFYRNVYPASAIDDQNRVKLKAYDHPNNRLSFLDRVELISAFDTGMVSHKLLVGTEYSWQRGNDRQTLPGENSKGLPGTYPVSNPTVPPVSFPFLDRDNHVIGKEFGVYVQDEISFGQYVKALVGVRWDRFSVDADYRRPGVTPNHTHAVDTEWSPRAGLIFKPVSNNSIYVSVTETFTPQGANIALSRKSPKGANLAPEKAVNYEIGNKLDLFGGNLSITAALFQLDLTDVVSNAADGSGTLVNTGKQRNRGIELSIEGALTSKWSIFANYTYLDAKITRTTKDAMAGAHVGLVPKNQFSVWMRYLLSQHWGIGGGIRGESRKFTSFSNEVVLPGYIKADAMVYYRGDNYRVQVNIDNITDKTYYPTASGDNQILPGAPRSITASLSVDF